LPPHPGLGPGGPPPNPQYGTVWFIYPLAHRAQPILSRSACEQALALYPPGPLGNAG
jgi:hypothetical protein